MAAHLADEIRSSGYEVIYGFCPKAQEQGCQSPFFQAVLENQMEAKMNHCN